MTRPDGVAVDDWVEDPGRRSWDSAPAAPPRPYQALWVSIAALVLPLGLLATALRVIPPTSEITALLASFIGYGTLAYAVSLLFFLIAVVRARRRILLAVVAAATAALLACHVAWLAPLFVPDSRPAATEPFTLMSLNMLGKAADSQQIMRQAATADVVVLVEATRSSLQALEELGWNQRFPYVAGGPPNGDPGSAIYSRYPLSEETPLPEATFRQRAATVLVPDIGAVRIMAVHPCNPFCGAGTWRAEHDIVRSAAAANMQLPLVVAGDFNAVDDHLQMRRLRRDGLESATAITGAGWLPTYPANRLIPPTIPIDHVLLNSKLTATSISSFTVAGTDHLGLMTAIAGTERSKSGAG